MDQQPFDSYKGDGPTFWVRVHTQLTMPDPLAVEIYNKFNSLPLYTGCTSSHFLSPLLRKTYTIPSLADITFIPIASQGPQAR